MNLLQDKTILKILFNLTLTTPIDVLLALSQTIIVSCCKSSCNTACRGFHEQHNYAICKKRQHIWRAVVNCVMWEDHVKISSINIPKFNSFNSFESYIIYM